MLHPSMREVEPFDNQLLAALPPSEHDFLQPHVTEMQFDSGQILFDPGDILRHVYFPTTAVISIMNVLDDGQAIEVAAVGHEGMAGIRLLFDDDEALQKIRRTSGCVSISGPSANCRTEAPFLTHRGAWNGRSRVPFSARSPKNPQPILSMDSDLEPRTNPLSLNPPTPVDTENNGTLR